MLQRPNRIEVRKLHQQRRHAHAQKPRGHLAAALHNMEQVGPGGRAPQHGAGRTGPGSSPGAGGSGAGSSQNRVQPQGLVGPEWGPAPGAGGSGVGSSPRG